MARIINNKFLFIHVAKTGGTFVRELFNYYGVPNWESGDFMIEDHYSLNDTLDKHPDLDELTSFGFIRHPVSWYRSRWAYAVMTNFKEKMMFIPEAKKHWMADVWSNDLNVFVENTLRVYPNGIAGKYFEKMLGNIYEPDDFRIHKVFRYEDMNTACKWLLLNLKVKYYEHDPIWKSKHKESKRIGGEISPELVKGIEKAESKLIREFY